VLRYRSFLHKTKVKLAACVRGVRIKEVYLKNIPKKQHYVPQFILRNFSIGKKNKIFVFDKKLNRSFPSNVRDIGHENNFYEDQVLGYGNKTEFKLSELETIVAPIVEKIISQGSIKKLEEWEHKWLCLFSTIQMLRTNDTREFLEESNKIISEKIKKWGYSPKKDVENYKEMSKDEIKSSSIDLLNSLPASLVGNFLDKKLSLLESPKNQNFYLSDNPVVMHNHLPREGRGNLGIGLKGIQIYFPISSKYCLSFLCSDLVQDIRKKIKNYKAARILGVAPVIDISEAENMISQFENKTTNKLLSINMDFNNSLQVIHSTRFIYSSCDKFLLAKDMLKTNPEISNQSKVVDGSKTF
jgi:hypothetical protein